MQDVIKINQEDNVAVALRPIAKGETLDIAGTPVTTLEEIPQGHKVAIKPIAQGGNVIKYGFRIGIAKEDIKVGQWVHVHNIKTALGDLLTYEYEPGPTHLLLRQSTLISMVSVVQTAKSVSAMRSGSFRLLDV